MYGMWKLAGEVEIYYVARNNVSPCFGGFLGRSIGEWSCAFYQWPSEKKKGLVCSMNQRDFCIAKLERKWYRDIKKALFVVKRGWKTLSSTTSTYSLSSFSCLVQNLGKWISFNSRTIHHMYLKSFLLNNAHEKP
jgi:hypothetical protein